MRLCVFEDQGAYSLAPLTLTRSTFDLRCGAFTMWQRQRRLLSEAEAGAIVRPSLSELCRLMHPDLSVNDLDWLAAGPALMVNARWLPLARPVADLETPHVGLIDGQVAYAVP